ncbi:DUF3617 family protein [Bradyrhizobium sp. SYSU BS000235]|uniref:DUF3617 family protein n=1 Tax=Bradyrhizobium sp. SYSU BS000235 TaxID=3411332 RepID=UPI003C741947
MKAAIVSFALILSASGAVAQDAVPLITPKPVFVPGEYETESRNSHFQNQPAKSKTCVASADFDHFRDETLQQYRSSESFNKSCTLGETKSMPNGFAFAMDCNGAKTIVTFRFAKDLVSQTIETLITGYKAASSSILTMMRRVGDCPGQMPGKGT